MEIPLDRYNTESVVNTSKKWGVNFTRTSISPYTFSSEPQKLYFAVRGDLKVVFERQTFVFKDMYLAKGDSKDYNGWWLAGKYCWHFLELSGVIECQANEGGGSLEFELYGVGKAKNPSYRSKIFMIRTDR